MYSNRLQPRLRSRQGGTATAASWVVIVRPRNSPSITGAGEVLLEALSQKRQRSERFMMCSSCGLWMDVRYTWS